MLTDINWPYHRQYRSGTDHEPLEFYLNGLLHAERLDLLLGYFSFSAINVLSLGFAQFLSNGGKMRIIANNVLSEKDKQTIVSAKNDEPTFGLIDLTDIKSLKFRLDDYGRHFFECMAWLLSQGRIEIVLVKPKDKRGISHFKSGVFYDKDQKVCFKASCNFTASGMLENLEELEVFLKWENSRSSKCIEMQEEYFEEIFSGNSDAVEYVPAEEIEVALRNEFGNKELKELLTEAHELYRMKGATSKTPRVSALIRKTEEELSERLSKPQFPYDTGPREYQKEAYQKWLDNGLQGIFAMATGTGKTITSLNCVLNEFNKSDDQVYHAFILVPTITLVEQWAEEAKSFNFQDVITVSSKTKWESRLATMLSTAKRIPTSFIIIGTYASFIRDRFHKYAKQLPVDTIFIADEAHNIGSRSVVEKLKAITLEKRIGLSATPKRIYDPEGSEAMEQFFGDAEPYTYSFSMEKAITDGILCQYDYHPHLVQLTSDELEEYAEITKKLARLYSPSGEGFENSEIAERLLLKRKRIIHKAENKLSKTLEILQNRYEEDGNLEYTFVYVPEGYATNVSEVDQVTETNEENLRIINQYTSAIGNIDTNILVNQFVSGMPDRDAILDQFKQGRIQVIASMKCLDEGVDIPRAQHAIFCSSTGNPRQFIQRRGRILRKHPDKHKATIHDLVVIPDLSASSKDSDTYNLERNMVKKEIERVMYFASLSENPYVTEHLFEEVCEHYDLNIYTIYEDLKTS